MSSVDTGDKHPRELFVVETVNALLGTEQKEVDLLSPQN